MKRAAIGLSLLALVTSARADETTARGVFKGGPVEMRVASAFAFRGKDRTLDVALDVPVASDDHGVALGADGGDPGKAYLACHAALIKGDEARLKALLPPDRLQQWDKAQKGGNLPKFVNHLRDEHGLRSVKVGRGWSKGDRAVLLIAGEAASGPVTGEVTLLNEKGTWRVDDELTEPNTD